MSTHTKTVSRIGVAVLLALAVSSGAILFGGQSLAGAASVAAPEKLWTAIPLVVTIPPPPVPVTSYTPGETVGRIVIPKISLDLPLLEMANCDDQANLDRGPCHIGGTALPGRKGNSGIAGHRSTYSSPFRGLGSLAQGDEIIIVESTGARYVFHVTGIWVVSPSAVSVLDPTPEPSITLVTCHPIGSDASRLIVRAVLSD